MTDKPADKKDQQPADPKRPHATLDLKATEMKSGAAKDTAAASASASSAASTDKPTGASKSDPHKPAAGAVQRSPSAFTRLVTHLTAGIVGGGVVLFGGDRLAQMIGAPNPGARVEQVATDLDKRLAALEAAPKSDAYDLMQSAEERLAKIDTLAASLDTLRADQSKLAEKAEGLAATVGGTQGLAAIDTRIAGLEDQLKTLASAASSDTGGNRISDIAAVTSRISESESRFSSEVAKLRDGIAREIDSRLAVREDTSKTDLARLTQSVEKLKADQTRLDKSVQAAQEESGRVASSLGDIKSTLDNQSKTFAKATDVAAAVGPVTGLISKIEGNLDSVLQKEKERQSHTERIVTALELGNLKRAIESGDPFAGEFDAVNAASGNRLDLKPLEPFKTTGVPSLTQLKQDARPALLAALDSANVDPSASVWDRLMASATSVVRIRKIDADEGDTGVEATIARIEQALADNRLAEVLAEARKLPPEASAKIAPWIEKIAARHSVDEAIANVENELKAALAAPAAASPAAPNE
ncbi:MAG: hypothetical protein B7Y80_00785 [Hyphomicrobium sp. 32-62-53]|nr:MAG: hypothetical protein B7Z29_14105 [Hyphomicrobium sp. 12-62-95]OYY01882.1 MAG: hypothetical protein B7Y80_00785 [Hyphomicrobium sp. 32-62-53]